MKFIAGVQTTKGIKCKQKAPPTPHLGFRKRGRRNGVASDLFRFFPFSSVSFRFFLVFFCVVFSRFVPFCFQKKRGDTVRETPFAKPRLMRSGQRLWWFGCDTSGETAIGHFYGKKSGCSSDTLRDSRKHSATGVVRRVSRDRVEEVGFREV